MSQLKLPPTLIDYGKEAFKVSHFSSPGDMHELMELVRSGKVDQFH